MTAQGRLTQIWLTIPKGQARWDFEYRFLNAYGTPEERLEAWLSEQKAAA